MKRCALVGMEVKLKGVVESDRVDVDLEDSLHVFGSLIALHYKNYYIKENSINSMRRTIFLYDIC